MNPEKVLKAYFNGKEYYPFDEKYVWVKNPDGWAVVSCPAELTYTQENGLLEIIVDLPGKKSSKSCNCESRSLLTFGCQCGGN